MKKLFLASALALFGAMNAQTEKGSWVVSGKTGLGFNSVNTKYKAEGQSYDGPKVSTFSITPSVGYFVIDNLAAGIDLSYISTKTKVDMPYINENYESTTSTFAIMPNATYYFPTGSSFRPYVGAGVGYGTSKGTESDAVLSGSESAGGLLWGAKGGFVYLMNSTVGLDLGLGYNSFQNKKDNVTTNVGTFGVNLGVSFFLK